MRTRFPVISSTVLLLTLCIVSSAPSAFAQDTEALRMEVERLSEASRAGEPGPLRHMTEIGTLYGTHHYQFLWFADGPLAALRNDLAKEIARSSEHGLPLNRYHYAEITSGTVPEPMLELLLTDAFLSQVQDRYRGAVEEMDDEWYLERESIDPVTVLHALLEKGGNLESMLHALWPQTPEYWALVEKRATLAAAEDTNSQPVEPGPALKHGATGARVEQLQARLLAPGAHSGRFDEALQQSVATFQRAAGLEADGIVGAATLQVLNATRFSWIERLDANLERWRWLPKHTPSTYIRVNIAAFQMRVIENNIEALAMDIIVGRPYRETPIFTEEMQYLVFFPYWNVPYSIAVKDKLPLLRQDPAPLAAAGYQARLAGSEAFVPVSDVDWQNVRPGQFSLRQLPGDKNALGKVKFMLPNQHSVYLHDTPDKALFKKTERTFSSGCIRLAEPRKLIEWVLKHDESRYLPEMDRLFESGETVTAYLKEPVPVYLVYFTAFAVGNDVVFRRDVYARDQRIIDQLKASDRTQRNTQATTAGLPATH